MVVLAELAFSASDLAQMRFAVSPMWEIVTSFRLLASGSPNPVHRRWIEQVRPRVAAAGLEQGWLAELIPPSGYFPDFLNPAPAGPSPTLAIELAAIQAVPADRVRRDLDHLGGHLAGLGTRLGPCTPPRSSSSPPRSPPRSSPAPSASIPTSPSPGNDSPPATGQPTPPKSASGR